MEYVGSPAESEGFSWPVLANMLMAFDHVFKRSHAFSNVLDSYLCSLPRWLHYIDFDGQQQR